MSYKIDRKYSPNKSDRRGYKPDMIVSHITEGNYAGAVSWLCNPQSKASSHFVVSKKGEITQLVPLTEMAWINGTSTKAGAKNHYSKSSLKLVRDRKTNANYYTIGIEHEGFSNQGQGKLTTEQFKATVWLHKYIIKEVKRIYGVDIPIDRNHLVGHFEIDPIRKPNCPGKNFQWNDLIGELRNDKVEELIDMALEKWQETMGKNALDSLNKKKDNYGQPIVNDPIGWKNRLEENIPAWLFWGIIDRIAK